MPLFAVRVIFMSASFNPFATLRRQQFNYLSAAQAPSPASQGNKFTIT